MRDRQTCPRPGPELTDDLVVAVIVTVLLVPQRLAHALLAGFPPVVGVHLVAMVLALQLAAVFLVAALLRWDVFAAPLSAPALQGFITGAATVIAIGQRAPLLGVSIRGDTLTELVRALGAIESVAPHAGTAVIGLAAFMTLWLKSPTTAGGGEAGPV